MRTRVTKWFDRKLGINLYSVSKWALWDDPELRREYPNDYDWRYADLTTPDWERAQRYADALAADPDTPSTQVIYETGAHP